MPYNGSGTFVRSDGTRNGSNVYQQEAAAGIDIEAVNLDAVEQDMADGLTNAVTKDGQTVPTANLPMGTYKHTGVGNATADTQYAAWGQVKPSVYLGLEWQTGLVVSGLASADYTFTTSAGSVMDSTNTYKIVLPSSLAKDAGSTWAAGAGNGAYSNAESAIAADSWYTAYLVSKSSDPTDTDIVVATTQANALADTNVASAGYDIARPYYGGLLSNDVPNRFRGVFYTQNGLYKLRAATLAAANDVSNLTGTDEEGTIDIFAPVNHDAVVSIYAIHGGVSAQVIGFVGEESIGYLTPDLAGAFDFEMDTAGDELNYNKLINSGANQQAFVSADKASSLNITVRANTQGFYHNLTALT